ncbi:phosphatase PAP2 family protein [Candidatus Woesearchaeota archaeon]|nr:phosphatase PAP2 family protein [Candidatus Woesearchaeota archaeon]
MSMTPGKEVITDITSFGGMPIFLVAIFLFYFADQTMMWRLIAAIIVAYVVTIAIRAVYFKRRPDKSKVHTAVDRIAQSSFPSLHAMRSTILAILVMMFYQHPAVYVVGISIIVVTGFSRVFLKRHDSVDVIAGTIIGVLISAGAFLFV